jgi:hypothetical protein
MGFLSLKEDSVNISLVDNEGSKGNFRVKRILSKLDIAHAFNSLMESTPRREQTEKEQQDALKLLQESQESEEGTGGINIDTVIGMPEGQLAILEVALVQWDLKFPKKHPDHPAVVPLDREHINLLGDDYVTKLSKRIRKLNKSRTTEEVANLDGKSLKASTSETPSRKK